MSDRYVIIVSITPYVDGDPLPDLLARLPTKVARILARAPGCLCDAPEEDDKLRDSKGAIVGRIQVHIHNPQEPNP